MRYALLTGVLAAGVLASPLVGRDEVVDYAYVTKIVTVTAAESPAPSPTPSEVSVAAVPYSSSWSWWGWKSTLHAAAPARTTTAAPAPATTHKSSPKPKPFTSSTPTTKADATETTPSSSGGTPAYSDMVLIHHNKHRANHSAPDLRWDDALAATALKIAQTCQYEHNVVMDNGGYGQNIAAGSPAENISSVITEDMYNGEIKYFKPFYHQDSPEDMSDATFEKYGHFTQIVWKGSTHVGCCTYDCSGAGNGPRGLGMVAADVAPLFTVCNYGPPGNYRGQFAENVHEPEGQPAIDWRYGL